MIDLPANPSPTSVYAVRRQRRVARWALYAVALLFTLVAAGLGAKTAPSQFSLAFALFVAGGIICLLRPTLGLHITVVLAVFGDPYTVVWYPFTKNLSSRESVLFLSDGISFSPFEVYLGLLLIGWILQMVSARSWEFKTGRVFAPLMVFTVFVILNFGLSFLSGGANHNAALYEVRPLVYLPLIYVLATNLLRTARQYVVLYSVLMFAVFANTLVALYNYYFVMDAVRRDAVESYVSHGATIPMNALLIFILAAWMYRSRSQIWRYLLPVFAVPTFYIYILSQRRAAIVALVGGLLIFFLVMFWTHRRAFWFVVPVFLVAATLYTAAFWNSADSTVGFPAQAIKTVLEPDSVSERNQASDLYRISEKEDVLATIKSNPLRGVGFGHPFLRPVPLPAISTFPLADYMPHNSFLWLWMKVGIGGFIAFLALLGFTTLQGGDLLRTHAYGDFAVITLTSTTFVVMYVMFAYVDIAWDAPNMALFSIAVAQIATARDLWPGRATDETTAVEPVGSGRAAVAGSTGGDREAVARHRRVHELV
jgi:O-antigen ligase